jgi:hypothetical protein
LIAHGFVQPTDWSERYLCRLYYELGEPPSMRVIRPRLYRRDEETPIPHMYDQERLCLYLPGSGEWSSLKLLAHTIIPWTSLWLHYYELWHITGEWLGFGHEPPVSGPYPEEREVMTNEFARRR